METDRLQAASLQVQVQHAISEEPPFHKKCTISNLVKRPPVNIEFQDLKYTVHAANGGESVWYLKGSSWPMSHGVIRGSSALEASVGMESVSRSFPMHCTGTVFPSCVTRRRGNAAV